MKKASRWNKLQQYHTQDLCEERSAISLVISITHEKPEDSQQFNILV